MGTSSILGGERAPAQAAGKDVDALGPSDSSDSGSDVQGERPMATGADNPGEWGALTVEGESDSDAAGTGERASASGEAAADGADILPDRIIDPSVEDADAEDADAAGDLLAEENDDGDADEREREDVERADDGGGTRRRSEERGG